MILKLGSFTAVNFLGMESCFIPLKVERKIKGTREPEGFSLGEGTSNQQ